MYHIEMYKSQIKILALTEIIARPLQSIHDKTLHVVNGLQLNLDYRPFQSSRQRDSAKGIWNFRAFFPFIVRKHDNFPH